MKFPSYMTCCSPQNFGVESIKIYNIYKFDEEKHALSENKYNT